MIFDIWRFQPDASANTRVNRLYLQISRPALIPKRTDSDADKLSVKPSGCRILRDLLTFQRYAIPWIAIVSHDVGSRTRNYKSAFLKNPATIA